MTNTTIGKLKNVELETNSIGHYTAVRVLATDFQGKTLKAKIGEDELQFQVAGDYLVVRVPVEVETDHAKIKAMKVTVSK